MVGSEEKTWKAEKKWTAPLRPWAYAILCGLLVQVGAICRTHESDRDSSRE